MLPTINVFEILGSGGFSAASAIQQDDPIVESVSDVEHLTSTLIIAGGEGYIDFRSGEYIMYLFYISNKNICRKRNI